MSVTSAMFTGVTGVSAMGQNLQIIGNNISNANTVGYKASRGNFADLFSQAINTPGGNNQIGFGVRLESVQGLFSQGSFESTSLVTDVGINGNGYFRVEAPNTGDIYYTRAGQFRLNRDGYLVNPNNLFVQGITFDAQGNPTGNQPGRINLSSVTAPPNPTGNGVAQGSGVQLNVNLQATAEVNPGGGWNLNDPVGTSNFSTAISVYDSLGVAHTVLGYFQRTSQAGAGGATTSDWTVHLVADGADITGGTAGQAVEVGSGTLSFDVNGQATGNPLISAAFNFSGGPQQNQTIGFNFADSSQVGTGVSVTNSLSQDGYGAGNLEALDITQDGIIVGKFSNGLARNLAQFTLATFPAETELFRAGDNLFSQTPESGQALLGVANAGANGSILANSLELSNVDLTNEFVNMITTQRVYQANTKVITTADEMLDSVIQIKR